MEFLCGENTGQQGLTPLHCQLQLGRTEEVQPESWLPVESTNCVGDLWCAV